MRIYRIAEESNVTYVYRTCILVKDPKNGSLKVRSLYDPSVVTPVREGSPLIGKFYVGTKAKFCLAYYSGLEDLAEGETEVLLTLQVPANSVVSPEEDAYMGSEAQVENPLVVKIENVSDAENKPEYQ